MTTAIIVCPQPVFIEVPGTAASISCVLIDSINACVIARGERTLGWRIGRLSRWVDREAGGWPTVRGVMER